MQRLWKQPWEQPWETKCKRRRSAEGPPRWCGTARIGDVGPSGPVGSISDGSYTKSSNRLRGAASGAASGVALPSRREAACSTSAFAPATFSLTAFPNALAEPRRAAARRLLTGPAARTAAQSAEWTSVMV